MKRAFTAGLVFLFACLASAQGFDPVQAAVPVFAWPAGPAVIRPPALAAGEAYGGYAFASEGLYLARYRVEGERVVEPALLVLDPAAGTVTSARRLEDGLFPRALCVVGDGLFVGTSTRIHCYDRRTLAARGVVDLRALRPAADWWIRGMATDDGETFYLSFAEDSAVYRFVRGAQRLERWAGLPAGASPRGLALHQGVLYAVDSFHHLIHLLDTRSAGLAGQILFTRCSAYDPLAFLGDTLYLYDRDATALRRLPFQRVGGSIIRSDPVRYRVQARLTVRNASADRPVTGLCCVVAVPATEVHQSIGSLSFQGPRPRLERDRYGQEVAVFDLPRLAPGGETAVGWTAEATVWNVRHRIDGAQLRPDGAIPRQIAADYGTTSYFRLSAGDPDLDRLARELAVAAGSDALRLVGLTRDAVWDRLSYELHSPWREAAGILRAGRGTCGEYSFLISALLRRSGLPTRFVGASTSRGLPSRTDEVYHGWIEVWLPGYGWAPMDANMEDNDRGAPYPGQLLFGESRNMLVVSRGGHEDETRLGANYNCRVTTISGAVRAGIAYDWEQPAD